MRSPMIARIIVWGQGLCYLLSKQKAEADMQTYMYMLLVMVWFSSVMAYAMSLKNFWHMIYLFPQDIP